MIKNVIRFLHFIGGDELLLKIMLICGSAFFEYVVISPNDGPQVNVIVLAVNKFHLDSFLSTWREDDTETDSL